MPEVNIAVHAFALAATLILIFCILSTKEKMPGNASWLLTCALFMNAATLVLVIVVWGVDGNAECEGLGLAASAGAFISTYFLISFFTTYIFKVIDGYSKIPKWSYYVVYILALVSSIGLVLMQSGKLCFYYVEGGYVRAPLYFFCYIGIAATLLFQSAVVLIKSRYIGFRETALLLFQWVFILAAVCLQYISGQITLMYIATTLSLLMVFASVHVEQQRKMEQQQEQLAEQGISLMISQIQPHFLYNSLTVIDYLCKTDPQKAREAVAFFSTYLRCNLSSLKKRDLIPFSEERKHIEAYLSLEKLRFGELLNVEYDIKADGFLLPALSVQPLVENSVKHGLGDKENGGTIRVSSEETENSYIVTVSDDGVGFSEGDFSGNGEHIGIKSIRERLETMCGGKLTIESAPGKGTTAKVIISKGGSL